MRTLGQNAHLCVLIDQSSPCIGSAHLRTAWHHAAKLVACQDRAYSCQTHTSCRSVHAYLWRCTTIPGECCWPFLFLLLLPCCFATSPRSCAMLALCSPWARRRLGFRGSVRCCFHPHVSAVWTLLLAPSAVSHVHSVAAACPVAPSHRFAQRRRDVARRLLGYMPQIGEIPADS